MAEFSVSEAAFTGLRLVRERPRAVAVWILVGLVMAAGYAAGMVATAGPALMRAYAQAYTGRQDPSQALAAFHDLLPFYGLSLLWSLVFHSVVWAAMNRAVLRPDEDRFGYLRLGGDELRQLLLLVLWGLTMVGIYIAAAVALVILMIVLGIAGSAIFGSALNPAGGGVLIAVFGVMFLLGALAVAAIRLSLASPLTFATGKVDLFGSWRLTRGRFWALAGTYLLVTAVAFVLGLAAFSIFAVGVMLAGGGLDAAAAVFRPDMSSLKAYFSSPVRIAYMLVSAVTWALFLPLFYAPAAYIYQRLAAAGARPGGV